MSRSKHLHQISLSDASSLTKRYRESLPKDGVIAHYMDKTTFSNLLNQSDCKGIRVYHGIDEEGKKQLVFTGVDKEGNDIFNGVLAHGDPSEMKRTYPRSPLNTLFRT